MATTTTTTNKPLNPRAQDLSPKGYNRANIFSGKALSFDGVNDQVTTALTTAASGMTTEGTISAIVKLNQIGNFEGLFGFRFSGTSEFFILLLGSGQSEARLRTTSGVYDINVDLSQYVGQYTNFVFTFGGGSTKLYANGRLIGSNTYAGTFVTSTDPTSAFNVGRSSIFYLNGFASNAKVFNVALTPAQVSDLYLNPEKIVPDGVASSALKLWLPMMEGAGASAYDGSGNGNDGTINGATWAAGIGAPVAQTALVSWNKGTNRLQYSEDFTNAAWTKERCSVTANADTAPNGTTTADRITSASTTFENYVRQAAAVGISAGTTLTTMAYAKKGTHTFFRMRNLFVDNGADDGNAWFNLDTGAVGTVQSGQTATMTAVGNGWYLCTLTGVVGTTNLAYLVDFCTATTNGTNVPSANGYTSIWGTANYIGAVGPYIKTNATAQTSAVLVPEGLTAGASIFGTDIITQRNAFALNLDGASYAGVKDNGSIDITSAASMEFWVNATAENVPQFIGKRLSGDSNWLRLYGNAGTIYFEGNSGVSINTSIPTSTWTHFVGTINGTSATLYKNGVSVATGSIAFSMSNAAPVGIGAWLDSLTQVAVSTTYVNGQLANPRIYNRALTAAEVLRNYNADKAKFGL